MSFDSEFPPPLNSLDLVSSSVNRENKTHLNDSGSLKKKNVLIQICRVGQAGRWTDRDRQTCYKELAHRSQRLTSPRKHR